LIEDFPLGAEMAQDNGATHRLGKYSPQGAAFFLAAIAIQPNLPPAISFVIGACAPISLKTSLNAGAKINLIQRCLPHKASPLTQMMMKRLL